MKKCTLDLVNKQHNGINEIRANIRYFNREAMGSSDNSSRARKLLTGTSYWLYDEATDAFGPSKFVGFSSMTFECYDYWVEKAKTRKGKFFGGDTRKANEKTMGTNFAPNPSLAKKLVEWGEKLFVTGIFKGTWDLIASNPHPIFEDVGILERTYKCSECGFTENRKFNPHERNK